MPKLPVLFSKLRGFRAVAALAGCMMGAVPTTTWADPFEEIAAFSSMGTVDREKIDQGEIVTERVPGLTLQRGMIVESVFRVAAPISKTIDAWKAWNGTRHPELKVYLHGDLPGAGTLADYQKLTSAPAVPAVRTLAAATEEQEGVERELQMNQSELALYPRKGTATDGTLSTAQATFWATLLNGRAHTFMASGFPALLPYSTVNNGEVSPAQELNELLGAVPKMQAQFQRLLDSAGLKGKPTGQPMLYWELSNADSTGALTLGASVQALDGHSIQAVDLQVYASSGTYTMATLTQFWPGTTASGPVTLVWRADLLSAGRLGELRGLERVMAGSVVKKQLNRVTKYFQADAAAAK